MGEKKMRLSMRVLAASVLVLATVGATGIRAADDAVMAPIQKFVDSFNKGDAAAAAATHAAGAELAIMDEVPPYIWRGAQAFQTWSADLAKDSEKQGITDQAVTLGAPTRQELSGDRAYVVVPAVYTFKQRGVSMREAAQMTFALKKEADGWRIHGWTWTGPKPQAVAPAAKP
jgi:ketosteroid isomerase-like protein